MNKFIITFLVLFSTLAAHSREITFSELSEIDPQLEEKLQEAGFEGDVQGLSMVVDDSTDYPSFTIRHVDYGNWTPAIRRNFFVASVLLSSIYNHGASLSYNITNAYKGKVSWSINGSYTQDKDLKSVSLAFNKHIGKGGFFMGINGEIAQYNIEYIEGTPSVRVPFVGLQLGWNKGWGESQRLRTGIQVSAETMNFERKILIMPEARVSIGFRLNGGKKK